MSEPSFICPECRVGHLHSSTVFYGHWMGDTFLTVPDFPAWICDVCGAREYDHLALHDLRATLGGSDSGSAPPQRDSLSGEDASPAGTPGRPDRA